MAQNKSLKKLLEMSIRKMLIRDKFSCCRTRMFALLPGASITVAQNHFRRFSTSGVSSEKKIDKIELSNFIQDRNSFGFGNSVHGKYDKVSPQEVSARRSVPDGILTPDYYERSDGMPKRPMLNKVKVKTPAEIEIMRESCRLTRDVMESILAEARPGVTTDDLDKYAHELIIKHKAFPSALNYRKFPKSICTSVNNVACHGIPDNRKLISGDIVTVDVMVYKNGFHGDCAATELIGDVDDHGQQLVDVAEECLMAGIRECGPGKPFSSIGKAIEAHANMQGYSVLHGFTGHGIGRNVHEKPDIYHYDRGDNESDVMKPGMVFTVEPIITQGMDLFMVLNDGWTAVTVDGARAAQFEHTLLITETGIEVLTDIQC